MLKIVYFCPMAKVYTTEIASEEIASDNPIHQRLFKAYVVAQNYVHGNLLEVGCGEGRGVALMMQKTTGFTAIDKIQSVVENLQKKHPAGNFIRMNIPPFGGLASDTFDSVISFQVIEHIQNDLLYLQEIHRVMTPGGIALLTTPNRKMSLSRNPWHIREYLADELKTLAAKVFSHVEMKGITGNEKVMAYYEENKRSVQRIMKWDFLNLQYRLPASILRIPYEILNRKNRNKLQSQSSTLVSDISHEDYRITDDPSNALDLFLIVRK